MISERAESEYSVAEVECMGVALVVDDSAICRKVVGNSLRQLGFLIDEADDGTLLSDRVFICQLF